MVRVIFQTASLRCDFQEVTSPGLRVQLCSVEWLPSTMTPCAPKPAVPLDPIAHPAASWTGPAIRDRRPRDSAQTAYRTERKNRPSEMPLPAFPAGLLLGGKENSGERSGVSVHTVLAQCTAAAFGRPWWAPCAIPVLGGGGDP